MKDWIENVVVLPALGLALVSIVCDIFVIASTRRLKLKLKTEYGVRLHSTHDFVICQLVFWLCIINVSFSSSFIFEYGVNWRTINTFCITFGFLGQFNTLMTSFWHMLFSGYLFYLLKYHNPNSQHKRNSHMHSNKPSYNYNNTSYDQHTQTFDYQRTFALISILIVVLSFIGSIIPMYYNHSYGIIYNYTDNTGDTYGTECWLLGYWQLMAYGPLLLSLLVDIIVLLFAVCKYCQTKKFTNAYLSLIARLSIWVIIFAITRVVPFMDRVLILISNKNYRAPIWLVLLHHCTLASFGIGNAIAWYCNRKIKPKKLTVSNSKGGGGMNKHVKNKSTPHAFLIGVNNDYNLNGGNRTIIIEDVTTDSDTTRQLAKKWQTMSESTNTDNISGTTFTSTYFEDSTIGN